MPTDLDIALKEASVYLNGELEKQAQNPLAGLFDSIPDEAKAALRNSLIGGLIGAGGGAMAAGPDNRMQGILAGGGLGALTGGAGTLGMNLLGGQLQFPGEAPGPSSVFGNMANSATGLAASNPGLTAGSLLGLGGAYKYGPKSQEISEYLRKVMKDTGEPGDEARAAWKAIQEGDKIGLMDRLRSAWGDVKAPLDYSGPNVATDFKKTVLDPLKAERGWLPGQTLSGSVPAVGNSKTKALAKSLSEALFGNAAESTTGVAGTIGRKGSQLASAGGHLASASRINRILNALPPSLKRSKLPWALLPLAAGSGLMLDKYLKGDY